MPQDPPRDPRLLCTTCLRPRSACYCGVIERVETRTRVLILQHPRERRVPVNTARIAHLALPNSELRIGIDFSADAVVRRALEDPARPARLLFPGDGAMAPRDDEAATGPVTVVVLDGTWSQASKLLQANPFLGALRRYAIAPEEPSGYRIRRQPRPHCLSTIEAIAEVLGELEGDRGRTGRILEPFRRMVETQLACAGEGGAGRSHPVHVEEPPLPASLRGRPGAVVLACGEANAWARNAGGPPPEIIHWVAIRPATGARFEAVIQPKGQLAPSCPHHLGLDPTELARGEPIDSFAQRWRAFVTPGDIVVTWGGFASDVLERQGVGLGERVDLRIPALRYLRDRAGALEVCARELAAIDVSLGKGRAGRRLGWLRGVYEGLEARGRVSGGKPHAKGEP